TVGDTFEEVSTLVSFGVDGMFTDYPDRLDDILNQG
ncbi:MAG: glycerophosphodiester phosphodiesterase, partial [Actinobacteria bacterium]|nr:glycerophosphodiester phosphodiesterase [Actinomycetota bacterium]